MTAASFGFSCWQDRAARMASAHQHNDIEINLSHSALEYVIGGARQVVPAGRVSAFWGATPHQLIEVLGDAPVTWLTIPLARFLSWRVPDAAVTDLLAGRLLTAPADWSRSEAHHRFAQWRVDLDGASEHAEYLASLEVEAFACRFAAVAASSERASERTGRPGGGKAGDETLRRAGSMAGFIAEHYASPIRVADVAAVAHVHPHYATELFRRVFGVSVGSYLVQYRVGQAQRMLVTTDDSVSDIALGCGFPSQSAFYASFAASCGLPPTRYRRAHALR